VKKELEQAEQKRQEPGNNDAARIARDIVCANLRIGRYTQGLKNPTEPQAEVQERADCLDVRQRKGITSHAEKLSICCKVP